MINRIDGNRARENDNINKQAAARGYNAGSTAARKLIPNEHMAGDEVIAALANAHENRRARQVTEWESMRRYNVRSAA